MSESAQQEVLDLMPLALEPEIRARQYRVAQFFLNRFPELRSSILQEGMKEGTQHGLQPLAHLFERRLGRPLSPAELDTLSDRLERLGGSRLGDVVLDLSPEDLRAWLADSNAS